jgi:peptidoglycan/LPS O-acetylase OafA/YrhL
MSNSFVQPGGGGRNAQIDGLRAICVLFVIVSHLTWTAPFSSLSETTRTFLESLGQLGVEVFFGISGFIITRTLLEELGRNGRVSLKGFFLRRFFRIIPAYWAYLLVILGLMFLGEIRVEETAFVRSLLFISNLRIISPEEGWFVGHSWTLSEEEQYYVFFPVLFWTLLKGKRGGVCFVAMVLYLIVVYENRIVRIDPSFDTSRTDFIPWFKYILAGVVLALVWERVAATFRSVPALVPLAVILLLATRCFYTGASHLTATKYAQLTEALGIVFVIGWLIQNPGSCGFLRWRAMQWLGCSSYSFYLWQQLYTGEPSLYGSMVLSKLPMAMAMLLGTAALSYYLIEKPFIQLGRRLSARAIQPKASAPPDDRPGLLDEEVEAAKLPDEIVETEPIVSRSPQKVPK